MPIFVHFTELYPLTCHLHIRLIILRFIFALFSFCNIHVDREFSIAANVRVADNRQSELVRALWQLELQVHVGLLLQRHLLDAQKSLRLFCLSNDNPPILRLLARVEWRDNSVVFLFAFFISCKRNSKLDRAARYQSIWTLEFMFNLDAWVGIAESR